MYRDYAPKGVKFYYVYKTLAHPEKDGYVQPFTLKERLMHVKEAQRTLGSGITWICDSMSNDLKHALGDRPNSEFIIGPDGKVVRGRTWSRPSEVRRDLEELVGPIENPTQVADLNLKTQPPPKVAASGVVPRVQLPGRMRAIKIVPGESQQPYYMKLRAEVEGQVLQGDEGKIYLGFHVDPIYHVHWNNLVAPVKYEITTPDGITISPAKGEGPKVKEAADIDPREFLLDIKTNGDTTGPLQLTVEYFACNDEKGWCKPVTQTYAILLESDRDAGSPRRGGFGGRSGSFARRSGGGFGPGGEASGSGRRADITRIRTEGLFVRFDKNKDDKLAKGEVPPFLWKRFSRADSDGDGSITKQEFEKLRQNGKSQIGR